MERGSVELERARRGASDPLAICGIAPLMAWMSGDPDVVIGLIDGPVDVDHPGLEPCRIRGLSLPVGRRQGSRHGTFVAGVLVGRRVASTLSAPGLCPGCLVVSRPVPGTVGDYEGDFEAAPNEIAAAIEDCLQAGVRILNISVVLPPAAADGSTALTAALDRAARRGVLVVVAAGALRRAGGSALVRHPWVVPVAACTRAGIPLPVAYLGPRLSRRGLLAPGERITSLDSPEGLVTRSGAIAAVPFVTGAAALLWSALPGADVDALRHALLSTAQGSRAASVPPLMDAWAAFVHLRPLASRGPAGHQGRAPAVTLTV